MVSADVCERHVFYICAGILLHETVGFYSSSWQDVIGVQVYGIAVHIGVNVNDFKADTGFSGLIHDAFVGWRTDDLIEVSGHFFWNMQL